MNKKINLEYDFDRLFSIPMHMLLIDDFDATRNKLIDYAYNLKEKDIKGHTASNRGGYQSKIFNVHDFNDVLHDLLINVISNIPAFKKNVSINCRAWVNINPPKSYNVKHCHPGCDIAGVLWIKAPKKCGDIVFYSPFDFTSYREIHSYKEDFKKETKFHRHYKYTPREGMMLLFPSHLQHKVEPNQTDEDRISVSFNLTLTNVEI